ncbi:MAG: tRNA (adenosine(37)-N6)-dimethylallyltransferase MiaA [Pyrinomonadaceae bacterium]|nr:tRNA (adenosine(37)-N6)-dimethylallyltransferase MiaA [Acidobacteriota bacterium]MBP7377535.1 tRNA (adenosine(37)-N6)-dimethylallyltransferase MiaA [Pyrinomonadaceae bacterium]
MRASANRSIYCIAGPTASGKTALGVELALKVGGEVINCDSVQIYKGIQIATAKPSEVEKRGVPHHLIDYVDPNINYTAADWASDAAAKIEEIEARGNMPILVGGTGFYLRTLRQPLFDSPKTDHTLRKRLQAISSTKGAEYLHKMLTRLDPEAAAKITVRDYVRSTRALEVFFQTGTRISEIQPNRAEPPEFASRIRLFVLDPPRDVLYEKINARTEEHFAAGLVDEVKQLRAAHVKDDTNALGAHAYRRVCQYLRGERTLESAIEKSKQDVRNYAKRQLTWFRREPDAVWLDGFGGDDDVFQALVEAISA